MMNWNVLNTYSQTTLLLVYLFGYIYFVSLIGFQPVLYLYKNPKSNFLAIDDVFKLVALDRFPKFSTKGLVFLKIWSCG